MQFADTDFSNPAILAGFVLLMVLAGFTFFAIKSQGKEVWQTKTADFVPYPAYMGQIGFFSITFLYGIHYQFLGLIIIGPPRIAVTMYLLIGMWKVKPMTKTEIGLGVIILICILASIDPSAVSFSVVVLSAITLGYFGRVPIQMWKEQKRGTISLRTQILTIVGQFVWALYGLAIWDWLITGMALGISLLPITTLVVWLKVPENKELVV